MIFECSVLLSISEEVGFVLSVVVNGDNDNDDDDDDDNDDDNGSKFPTKRLVMMKEE